MTLGLAEILTGPAPSGALQVADRYVEEPTSFENLALMPLDLDVAREAAAIHGSTPSTAWPPRTWTS